MRHRIKIYAAVYAALALGFSLKEGDDSMGPTVMGVQERRNGPDRRSGNERRLVAAADAVAGSIVDDATPSAESTWRSAFEMTGYVVAAALGLFIYKVTGLYDAADSSTVRLGLGVIISVWFVLNVRLALHTK